MSNEKLSFGWNDYEINTLHNFEQLWNDKVFSDITLATEDNQHINAHMIILSSASLFFKNMFRRNLDKNLLVYLRNISYKILARIFFNAL